MDANIILNTAPIRRYSKGDIIYYQGDTATAFYYLKTGKVKVYMTSAEGMEKILSTSTVGEIIGEAAFFDKMPRISCAKALTDIELAVINQQTLMTLIQNNPQIALELLNIQANRIRQLSTQIDSMTFLQADGRIARLLLQSTHQETVHLTHEEIAGIIGVSRVTVSKILTELAKKGYIKTAYRKIIILQPDSLEQLCNHV